jgi:hypothetical protein
MQHISRLVVVLQHLLQLQLLVLLQLLIRPWWAMYPAAAALFLVAVALLRRVLLVSMKFQKCSSLGMLMHRSRSSRLCRARPERRCRENQLGDLFAVAYLNRVLHREGL